MLRRHIVSLEPARPAPRPYVPAGEPAHSEACYCAVVSVLLLPCANCRREGHAKEGAT